MSYQSMLTLFFVINLVSCQVWLTPTKRSVFGVEKSELTVEWKFDPEGKNLFYASWQRADETFQPFFSLVTVNKENKITSYSPNEVDSSRLGEIKFKSLDKTKDKRVVVSIEFEDTSTPLTDQLTIEYVDYPPFFSTKLPQEKLTITENSAESKNKEFTVIAKGKPKPMIIWKLNGNKVTSLEGFATNDTETKEDLNFVITSKLSIAQLFAHHNGKLQALVKYGDENQGSPEEITEMDLNIEYPPRNITFVSNITDNLIINEGYVGLTCSALANPPALYTMKEYIEVLYSGPSKKYTTYLDNIYHSNIAVFRCEANNTLGSQISRSIEMRIINGTLSGRQSDDEDSNWWKYYVVGVAIAGVVFIGVSATIIVIRSRMRSMNIRSEVTRVTQKSARNSDEYQRHALRNNAPNHAYNLNVRGAPDGVTKTQHDVNGVENDGFELL